MSRALVPPESVQPLIDGGGVAPPHRSATDNIAFYMASEVHRRPYDAFLSHAHADREFVDKLYDWLVKAGLNIWYDAKKMTGGQPIGESLQTAIEECRGVLLIGSSEAIGKGWVKQELSIAQVEQADSEDFRIVPLRIAGADVASLLKGQSWIDVPETKLTPGLAAQTLNAFYPGDHRPDPRTSRDVYLSASWRSEDNASALTVSRLLDKSGVRLVGDSKDQKGFKQNRIQSIIESCGAFACVIPYRGAEKASASEKPYNYFLTEIDLAAKAQLPSLVIADPRVHRADGDDQGWLRLDTQATECPPGIQAAINDLWDEWSTPPSPHEIFFAADLSAPASRKDSDARNLIERVTGMQTVAGNEIREDDLQLAIMERIKRAFLVIADVSGATDDSFNLDVCIEAGMALASEANLVLMAKGRTRRPPFMLRRAGQLTAYADETEQLALIHNLIRGYRRRVINAELNRY